MCRRQEAIQERTKELRQAQEKKLQFFTVKANNNQSYLHKIFSFYHPGRFVNYPMESFGEGNQIVPAVFIGYMVDMKKKNPYVPSQIKLRFAIANSSKYLAIPASYSKDITSIIGVSADQPQPQRPELLQQWETYIKQTNVDRKTRHPITGNLLQAFADNVTVPIIKALPLIKSIVLNSHPGRHFTFCEVPLNSICVTFRILKKAYIEYTGNFDLCISYDHRSAQNR